MNRSFWTVLLAAALLWPEAGRAQRIVEVQVAPPYLRMRPDAETSVLATAYDTTGNPVAAAFRWSSSNINVVQVSSDGVLKAVSPGAALVTATLASDPRLRGQVTVFVARPRPPAPPPPPAGVDSAPAWPPEPPPGRVIMRGRVVNVDSALRTTIDCDDPTLNAINPLRTCWEERATPRAASLLVPPAECGEAWTPVTLLVRVSETGRVLEVRQFAPSRCPAYTEAVVSAVRSWTFTPARRGGSAVEAWVLQRVAPPKRQL